MRLLKFIIQVLFTQRSLLFCFLASLLISNPSYSQSGSIEHVISTLDTFNNRLPLEKLYLHLDKTNYITNDTIWFKAYLVDDAFKASEQSGIFYLELVDNSNTVIRRMKFPINYGLSWGQIELDEDFKEGAYTIRAYTSWMRNFGEEAIFSKRIYIATPSFESWLVSTELSDSERKDTKSIFIQFNKMNKQPLGLQELELSVMSGKKTLYKSKLNTDPDGAVSLDFVLPKLSDAKDITLIVKDLKKGNNNSKLLIPLFINRPENTDLQFMPEGGHLVANLTSIIGFKAIGENGKGVEIEGKILNTKQQEVTSFKSLHKGMGSFELTPELGENYSAAISLPDGTTKSYPLPIVKTSGTVLTINNLVGSDSIKINLSAIADSLNTYNLIGQTNGKLYYAKSLHLDTGIIQDTVAKNIFPSGITRFTIFNESNQPLNERMIFINHEDQLNIEVTTDTTLFKSRDSISLMINVTNHLGNPMESTLSLSVTDDKQVKADSTTNSNIVTYFLLSSGLKGTVEEPNYYTKPSAETNKALDNLLLTQGWTSYNWEDVFSPKPIQFTAEQEVIINGRIDNTFAGIKNTKVLLYSQKPFLLIDTMTDEDGRFSFKNLPITETAAYFIQSWRRGGGSFLTNMTIERFQPPVFTPVINQMTPWYVNSDSTLLNSMQLAIARQKTQCSLLLGVNVLSEVTITARRGLSQVLDEQKLQKEGDMTLLDFMHKHVNGFRYGSGFAPSSGVHRSRVLHAFWIKDKLINFRVDKEIINNSWDSIYHWFSYLKVQEFKNIKVTITPISADVIIASRSGQGLSMKQAGTFLYRPIPQFSFPKQFYSPRYATKDSVDTNPDLRHTLYWEPNIITDTIGKAIVNFYAADQPSTYSVIVEGIDMNGKMGSVLKKALIKISPLIEDKQVLKTDKP